MFKTSFLKTKELLHLPDKRSPCLCCLALVMLQSPGLGGEQEVTRTERAHFHPLRRS